MLRLTLLPLLALLGEADPTPSQGEGGLCHPRVSFSSRDCCSFDIVTRNVNLVLL